MTSEQEIDAEKIADGWAKYTSRESGPNFDQNYAWALGG